MTKLERLGPGTTFITAGGLSQASVGSASKFPVSMKNAFASQGVKEEELFHLEYPLVHEGVNLNGDEFTQTEMASAYKTLIGTPLDKDHIKEIDAVVGMHYSSTLVTDADGLVIFAEAFIWADLYGDVVRKIVSGAINGVSMECNFAWAERTMSKRVLHDCNFIGAGLCRIPADPKARVSVKKTSYANYTPTEIATASAIAMKLHKERLNVRIK
jgi:hypothetical protein